MATKTKIRQVRESLGLSQVEVAAKAGVSLTTVFKVESGQHVTHRTKCKIARALGVPINEVLDDSPLASGR